MKKIEKYLQSIGYALLLSKVVRYQNSGGRSFKHSYEIEEELDNFYNKTD